jgi:hypothetical protein
MIEHCYYLFLLHNIDYLKELHQYVPSIEFLKRRFRRKSLILVTRTSDHLIESILQLASETSIVNCFQNETSYLDH